MRGGGGILLNTLACAVSEGHLMQPLPNYFGLMFTQPYNK